MVNAKRGAIAELVKLSSDSVLPRGIGGEEHDSPREQQRCGVVAREEEGLAFVHDELQIGFGFGFVVVHLIEQHSEQIVAVGGAPPDLDAVSAALYDLHQQPLHLGLERFYLSVVLAWEESVHTQDSPLLLFVFILITTT